MRTLVEEIAHFWSEWTDDGAPLRERGIYRLAAEDFVKKFDVKERVASPPPEVTQADVDGLRARIDVALRLFEECDVAGFKFTKRPVTLKLAALLCEARAALPEPVSDES